MLKGDELEKDKWYKDNEGDFIKFDYINSNNDLIISAYKFSSRGGAYSANYHLFSVYKYTFQLMTIEEMKEHLPEYEWWTKPSNELFPIF